MATGTQIMYYGEKFNALTHLAGAVLALAGAVVLIVLAALDGDPRKVVSVSIYGVTLVLLYTFSTLYHSLRGRAKNVLREMDHQSIYLLIAGSYTPFCLVTLRGPWGWSLLVAIWSLALGGIFLRLKLRGRRHGLVVATYIAMGWLVVVATQPMLAAVAPGGLALLAAGGIVYTAGVAFYKWKRLRYHHAIWHGFVMAGSACHFFAVLFYVIPGPALA